MKRKPTTVNTTLLDKEGQTMRFFKNAKVALLVPALMVASACTELALEPHAAVSNDAYFGSVADFEAAIVGGYDILSGAGWYGRSIHLMSDIMGNDVKQSGSANRYQEFADFEGQVVTAKRSAQTGQ